MSFDLKKPVQTRDGRKATILKTDLKDSQPVVAVVELFDGSESVETFNASGSFFRDNRRSVHDLVNSKRTVYINLYACRNRLGATAYNDKPTADAAATDDRTACIPYTFEE